MTTPMPGTCHPDYADAADWLRDWLATRPGEAAVWTEQPAEALWDPCDPPRKFGPALEQRLLMPRICIGLAPYVGRPFVYRWRVLIDGAGRGIAGEAEQVHATYPDRYLDET